jgi:hypothetical protein
MRQIGFSITGIALILVLLVFVRFLFKFVTWRLRLRRYRKHYPVVLEPIFDLWHLVRLFIPRRWQHYHGNWAFNNLDEFRALGSDIIALVPLFGIDVILVADAEAVCEIATGATRFPKDLRLYSIPPTILRVFDVDLISLFLFPLLR